MGNFNEKDLDLAKRAAKKIHLPEKTKRQVKLLRELNVFAFRKYLKEERSKLPGNLKKIYREDDDRVLLAMHYLRTVYPFFTEKEVEESKNYIQVQQDIADGKDPFNTKRH